MGGVSPLSVFAEPVWRDFFSVLPLIGAPETVRVVVLDDQTHPEVVAALPDACQWRDRSLGDSAQVLLLTAVSVTALDASVDDLASLYVELSSQLQDLVMDARNSAWPLVRSGDDHTVVAEPTLVDGRAYWAAHGRAVVEIGQLSDALAAYT